VAASKLQKRGTGLWFINSTVFETWKTERNQILWLYGSGMIREYPLPIAHHLTNNR